jgi:hypothetical protein
MKTTSYTTVHLLFAQWPPRGDERTFRIKDQTAKTIHHTKVLNVTTRTFARRVTEGSKKMFL